MEMSKTSRIGTLSNIISKYIQDDRGMACIQDIQFDLPEIMFNDFIDAIKHICDQFITKEDFKYWEIMITVLSCLYGGDNFSLHNTKFGIGEHKPAEHIILTRPFKIQNLLVQFALSLSKISKWYLEKISKPAYQPPITDTNNLYSSRYHFLDTTNPHDDKDRVYTHGLPCLTCGNIFTLEYNVYLNRNNNDNPKCRHCNRHPLTNLTNIELLLKTKFQVQKKLLKSALLAILAFTKNSIFDFPPDIIQTIMDHIFDEYNYRDDGETWNLFKISKGRF
jgi:hypothetical protein